MSASPSKIALNATDLPALVTEIDVTDAQGRHARVAVRARLVDVRTRYGGVVSFVVFDITSSRRHLGKPVVTEIHTRWETVLSDL